LKGINSNLKVLNDSNILHSTKVEEQHNNMIEKLKVLTEKYWWLIIALIGALLIVAGLKQVAGLFLPV